MARVATKPPNDPVMWRRAVAAVHPDRGVGDESLFIWLNSVRELLLAGSLSLASHPPPRHSPEPPPPSEASQGSDRINVSPGVPFEPITQRAWAKASEVEEPYPTLLRLTLGAVDKGRPLKGATYKQLTYAGRLHGLDLAERNRWYRLAEEVGLTSEHTSRIIERLKG